MTIAQAFNEIAVAHGGAADKSGTITGAIDALNDALAGSDQEAASTIEGAIKLLGQHIGGGSSVTVEPLNVTENDTYTAPEGKAYSPVTVNVAGGASFGPLQSVTVSEVLPAVGDDFYAAASIYEVNGGGIVFAQIVNGFIAAGLTAVSYGMSQYTECDVYVCVVDENYKYTSVTPWDGTVTVGSMEIGGDPCATYTLTVPELDFDPETWTGEYLVLYVHS